MTGSSNHPAGNRRTKKTEEDMPARKHSEYAKDHRHPPAEPEEKGDYNDETKDPGGRGNASEGPYKKQGGEGFGPNYGAREETAKPDEKP